MGIAEDTGGGLTSVIEGFCFLVSERHCPRMRTAFGWRSFPYAMGLGKRCIVAKVPVGAASVQPEFLPSPEKAQWIGGIAIDACLIVQMRTGGATGRADAANHGSLLHGFADIDIQS
jgi:hypothetical protein